jgi:hypothetical protein
MSSIQILGVTYHGPADGDYGVFTDPKNGRVFAGSHANGRGRVGVYTCPRQGKGFVECDADGKEHGRHLVCFADGYTEYWLYEHGNRKDYAVLFADGRCEYNGKDCSADFPAFVKLKAKVLPIKARPRAHSRQSCICPTHPPTRSPQIRPSAIFCTRRSSPRPTPPRCAPAAAADPHGRLTQPTTAAMHRTSNLDDALAACVVRPSAVTCPPCTSSEPPAPPLRPPRATRRRGASQFAAGCTSPSHTPHVAHAHRQRALPSRSVRTALRPHRLNL